MTDTDTPTTPCSRCQAPILEDDFEQGLALQNNGQSICKLCVDAGESEPQGNTQRSVIRTQIQQQNIHRYSDGKNPQLNRFTFLTAGHITLHRRVVKEKGTFDPPELCNNEEVKTEKRREQTTREATSPSTRRKQHEQAPQQKAHLYIGIAATVVVIGILSIMLAGDNSEQTSATTLATTPQQSLEKKYARSDFPSDALQAWRKAQVVLENDNPVLNRIADELSTRIARELKRADEDIEYRQGVSAHARLQQLTIPIHRRFEILSERKSTLYKRIDNIQHRADNKKNNTNLASQDAPDDTGTKHTQVTQENTNNDSKNVTQENKDHSNDIEKDPESTATNTQTAPTTPNTQMDNTDNSIPNNTIAICNLHTYLHDHHASCRNTEQAIIRNRTTSTAAANTTQAWKITSIGPSAGARHVLSADFNNDGFLDILFSRGTDSANTILYNDQLGGFSAENMYTFGSKGSGLFAIGDIDADGDIDVLCTQGQTLKLYHNNGTGFAFTNRNMIQMSKLNTSAKKLKSMTFADINEDQALDIVLFIDGQKNIVFLNKPRTSLSRWKTLRFGSIKTSNGLICDLNNDGTNDALEFNTKRDKGVKAYLSQEGGNALSTEIAVTNNISLNSKTSFFFQKRANKETKLTIMGKKHVRQFVFKDNTLVQDSQSLSDIKYTAKQLLINGDFNGDGQDGVITSFNDQPYLSTSDSNMGSMSNSTYKYFIHSIIDDFNNDGLVDCLFTNWNISEKDQPLSLFMRKSADMVTAEGGMGASGTNNSQPTDNSEFATTLFPLHTFLKLKKTQLKFEYAYNDLSTPVFDSDFRSANGLRRYRSNNKKELGFYLSHNKNASYDASTGGIIFTIKVPWDGQQLEITLSDSNKNSYVAPTLITAQKEWQFVCVDLRNIESALDTSSITHVKIAPKNGNSSAFYLSTVFIAQNGKPDPSIVPVMQPHPFPKFNAVNCIKKFSNRKFNLGNVHVLSHPVFFRKKTYNKSLSDSLGNLINNKFGVNNSHELEFTEQWINKTLAPKIFGSNKPSVLLIIGMGMQAQKAGKNISQTQLLDFWKKLVETCERNRVLPVIYTGPYLIQGAQSAHDQLCDDFLMLNKYGREGMFFPVIDMRGKYLTNSNYFKKGLAGTFYNRIAASYHNFCLRWSNAKK